MVNVNRGSVRPKAPKGGGGVCSSHRSRKLFERLVNPEKNHKLFRLDSISQCQLRVGRSQGSQGVAGVCVLLPGGGNLGGDSQASIRHHPRWKTSGICKNTNVGR